jgi:hypothetical protein
MSERNREKRRDERQKSLSAIRSRRYRQKLKLKTEMRILTPQQMRDTAPDKKKAADLWAKNNGYSVSKVAFNLNTQYFLCEKTGDHCLLVYAKGMKVSVFRDQAEVKFKALKNATEEPAEFKQVNHYLPYTASLFQKKNKEQKDIFLAHPERQRLAYMLAACFSAGGYKAAKLSLPRGIVTAAGNRLIRDKDDIQDLLEIEIPGIKTETFVYMLSWVKKAVRLAAKFDENLAGFEWEGATTEVTQNKKQQMINDGLSDQTNSHPAYPYKEIEAIFEAAIGMDIGMLNLIALSISLGLRPSETDRVEPEHFVHASVFTNLTARKTVKTKGMTEAEIERKLSKFLPPRCSVLANILQKERRETYSELKKEKNVARFQEIFPGFLPYGCRSTFLTNQKFLNVDSLNLEQTKNRRTPEEIALTSLHKNESMFNKHYACFSSDQQARRPPSVVYDFGCNASSLTFKVSSGGVEVDAFEVDNVWEVFLLRAYLNVLKKYDKTLHREAEARVVAFIVEVADPDGVEARNRNRATMAED